MVAETIVLTMATTTGQITTIMEGAMAEAMVDTIPTTTLIIILIMRITMPTILLHLPIEDMEPGKLMGPTLLMVDSSLPLAPLAEWVVLLLLKDKL